MTAYNQTPRSSFSVFSIALFLLLPFYSMAQCVITTPTDQQGCVGTITFNATSSSNSVNHHIWYDQSSNAISPTTENMINYGSGQVAWVSTLTVSLTGSATYYVAASCNTADKRAAIFTAQTPTPIGLAMSPSSNPNDLCAGETITLTASNGSSYQWRFNNPNDPSYTGGTTKTATQSGTYYLTGLNGCGVWQNNSIVLNFKPALSNVSISGTSAVCQGTSSTPYTANGFNVDLYAWSITDNDAAASATINSTGLVSWNGMIGTATITLIAYGCHGTSLTATKTVTVNAKAIYTVVFNAPGQICSANPAAPVSVNVTNGIGNLTYEWYLSTAGTPIGTTSVPYFTYPSVANGNTAYCKVISDHWCSISPVQTSSITLTVTPSVTPLVGITLPKLTYCSGESISFTASSTHITGSSTYAWKLNGTTLPNTTQSISLTTNSSNIPGNFYPGSIVTVDVANLSGTCLTSFSASGTTAGPTITINPLPNASAASPTICSGINPALAISTPNGVTGTTYTWTVTQSNVTGASNGSGVTISQVLNNTNGVSNGTATYTITPTSNTCAGPTYAAVVTVKPIPVINNLPATVAFCANATTGSAISFTPTATIAGTTYAWSNAISGSITGATPTTGTGAISQTVYNSGATAGSVVYTFTPTYNSCSGTSKGYTATINPKPIVGGLTNPSICSAQSTNFVLTSQASGTTYSWIQTQTNASGSSNGSGSSITQTLTNTDGLNNGTIVYTVTGTAGACSGTGTASVTVKPLPAFNPNPPAASIWTSGTASYAPVFTIPSSFSWISSVSGSVTGASASGSTSISNVLLNNGANSGTVTYAITPVSTAGSCTGLTKNFVVTVTPKPTILLTGAPGGRVALSKATLDVGADYTSYSWTNSSSVQVATTQSYLTSTPGVYTITVSKAGITGFGTASIQIDSEFSGLNENYIVTNTILVGNITDENSIVPLVVDHLSQTVQYFDGLGRPTQTVNTLGTPNKLDIVQPSVYDAFGREPRKYLPISIESNGRYKVGLLNVSGNYTNNFYSNAADKIADDTAPFAETIFEPSPLNRVLEQGAPGTAWQPGTDHSTTKMYEANKISEVLLFRYDAATSLITLAAVEADKYYLPNQLYANKTYDEHNNEILEFTDKQGRVLCKKVYVETISTVKQYACTYYVYDDFGNLVVVLPPEAIKKLLVIN